MTVLGSLCALNNLVTSGRFRLIFFAARTFGVPGRCAWEWLLQVNALGPPQWLLALRPIAGN